MSFNAVSRGRRAAAAIGAGALVVAGLAATYQQKFNTYEGFDFSSYWWENAMAALNVEGGQLSFSSVAPSTAALFGPKNWAMAYTKPWTASLDYNLAPGTVPSGAATGLVFRLGYGSSLPSLGFHYAGVAIYASEQGTFLGICDAGDMLLTDVEPVAAVPSSGTVVVSYNAKKDRVLVYVNNRLITTLRRFTENQGLESAYWEGSVELRADEATQSLGGPSFWAFDNGITVDNFKITGRGARPIPQEN